MRIGTNELLIILAVALLIFGPKNLGKMFGKTINGFKKGMEESEDSDDSEEKAEKKAAKKDEDEE
jgi:sec-independent protein translocase protein TatA